MSVSSITSGGIGGRRLQRRQERENSLPPSSRAPQGLRIVRRPRGGEEDAPLEEVRLPEQQEGGQPPGPLEDKTQRSRGGEEDPPPDEIQFLEQQEDGQPPGPLEGGNIDETRREQDDALAQEVDDAWGSLEYEPEMGDHGPEVEREIDPLEEFADAARMQEFSQQEEYVLQAVEDTLQIRIDDLQRKCEAAEDEKKKEDDDFAAATEGLGDLETKAQEDHEATTKAQEAVTKAQEANTKAQKAAAAAEEQNKASQKNVNAWKLNELLPKALSSMKAAAKFCNVRALLEAAQMEKLKRDWGEHQARENGRWEQLKQLQGGAHTKKCTYKRGRGESEFDNLNNSASRRRRNDDVGSEINSG